MIQRKCQKGGTFQKLNLKLSREQVWFGRVAPKKGFDLAESPIVKGLVESALALMESLYEEGYGDNHPLFGLEKSLSVKGFTASQSQDWVW